MCKGAPGRDQEGRHLFRGVHSAVHAAVAAFTWWVLQHWDQLQAASAQYKNWAAPAVLAALALLFRLSYPLSTIIIEKIPVFSRLLRRTLVGNGFIEGDWPLVVVDMQTQKPLYFGFLNIDFCDGQLYVSGDDWNPDGTHAQAFHSVQSLYRNRTLHYWYEQGELLRDPSMRGYTVIYFFPEEGVAKRHAGNSSTSCIRPTSASMQRSISTSCSKPRLGKTTSARSSKRRGSFGLSLNPSFRR